MADASRLALSGPDDVRLKPKAAGALHMVLHELGANALKHGALHDGEGRVEFEWRTEPSGALTLIWKERGGPAVRPPTRRGFGGELITGAVPHELQGDVRWEFEPDGVRCEIRVPSEWVERTPA
jgi:two-component sensor histidine kinase